MKQFEINDKNEGQRFDKFLQRILKNAGTSFIYKMLRKKNITLNEKKADGNVILKSGDVVKIYFSDDTYNKMAGETAEIIPMDSYTDINLNKTFKSSIIYEDENIILINKPAGILSQKAKPDDISINEYVSFYLLNEGSMTEDDFKQYKPSAVNRLDRNTSGIIIVAKNLKAAAVISKGLKDRTINKYYKCVVKGSFDKEGLYSGYLSKDNEKNLVTISSDPDKGGSYIETQYELLEDYSDYSILSVHLLTGRTHQIRAHLAYLGYPIIGDSKYGDKEVNAHFHKNGQMLHAYKLVFPEYPEPAFKQISGKTFMCDIEFMI